MSDDEIAPEMLARLGINAIAMLWAQEFNKTAIKLGYSEMDEGWLTSWFANAIENCDMMRRNPLRANLAAVTERMSKLDFERTVAELERDSLRAENERMREALSYYAEENYNGHNGSGACARAALEGAKEKKGAENE